MVAAAHIMKRLTLRNILDAFKRNLIYWALIAIVFMVAGAFYSYNASNQPPDVKYQQTIIGYVIEAEGENYDTATSINNLVSEELSRQKIVERLNESDSRLDLTTEDLARYAKGLQVANNNYFRIILTTDEQDLTQRITDEYVNYLTTDIEELITNSEVSYEVSEITQVVEQHETSIMKSIFLSLVLAVTISAMISVVIAYLSLPKRERAEASSQ